MRWCLKQRWTKVAEPFAGIAILGERSRGKEQLDRVDDARGWLGNPYGVGALAQTVQRVLSEQGAG